LEVRVIHLVVSCTKRKRKSALVRLRDIPTVPVEERAALWLKRLRKTKGANVPARHLYAGDHWSVVCDVAPRPNVRVWVCSAGYGLVGVDDLLLPYSATFAVGDADSVAAGPRDPAESQTLWWEALTSWEGPAPGQPRSLAELARAFPSHGILVALPATYLSAVAEDLRAATTVADPERCAVLSAGAGVMPGVEAWQVPADARLQQRAGGSRAALNARLARLALSAVGEQFSGSRLRWYFDGLMAAPRPSTCSGRKRATDDEVSSFIRSALASSPDTRATPLLNRYRNCGRACEQSRFLSLFRQVRGTNGS
jgi:hypothetical protein